MDANLQQGKLLLKTDLGCWALAVKYDRSAQRPVYMLLACIPIPDDKRDIVFFFCQQILMSFFPCLNFVIQFSFMVTHLMQNTQVMADPYRLRAFITCI